jgi:DNA polymerase I
MISSSSVGWTLSLDDVSLHLVESIDDAFAFKRWLGERRPEFANGMPALSADTETTGLSIEKDHVRLAQVGDALTGWAIPWDRWSGVFEEFATTWDGLFLFHNAKFDIGHLDSMGVKLPRARVWDTRIMAHILHPHMSTALKPLASRYVDPRAGAAQHDLDDAIKRLGWAGVPVNFGPYWQYGALDPVLTQRVGEALWPRVQVEAPHAFELENTVSWVIEKMERNGAFIDQPYAQYHYDKFLAFVVEADRWVQDNYGVKAGSNADIIAILADAGFKFTKATASGAVALDKEVLEGIDHPLAQTVLKRRQVQKLASTYLRHYITECDEDSLIHPSINVLGARTSRMSMQNPNLQNLPRKSEANRAATVVRKCIATRHNNGRLIMCDFDQIEMRMLAGLSNDSKMITAFKEEGDFFVNLARELFEDNTIEKKDPRRQLTKNTGYATVYGAGYAKLAKTAGVPQSQAKAVQDRFNSYYDGQAHWRNNIVNTAMRRLLDEGEAYVRCPITNRKHVADRRKEYALVNFMIQGGAAAIFKRKLIELDHAGLSDYLVAPVHDEIIGDFPEDVVPDAIATLRDIMNDTSILPVPITAGISHGRAWGEKEDYDA